MLKQVQHDRTKEKAEIATGTTCPRNGSGAVGLPRRILTHPHRNGERDSKTRPDIKSQGKDCGMTFFCHPEFISGSIF